MSKLLNEHEAADRLGMRVSTLRAWRCTRKVNIPFIRIGRSVKYSQDELDRYIEAATVRNAE